jgi:hypothetical protein
MTGPQAFLPTNFPQALGALYFMFGYDTNQMFARLVSVPEIEEQILGIEQEAQAQ